MSKSFNPSNSIWPNGIKEDSEGYGIFYPLGTNKVNVPSESSAWPDGDTIISPFVYKNGILVGFCDTKAMTASSSSSTTMPYTHIEVNFASINEGDLVVNAPNATVKNIKWATSKNTGNSGDTIVLGTKYLGCKTIDDIKVVDANYKTNDIIDGVWTQSLADLELSCKLRDDGFYEYGTAMFHGCSDIVSFTSDLISLTNGYYMFYDCYNLTTFTAVLSSLTNGTYMFSWCYNLTTFTAVLSSLTNGVSMFSWCSKLTTFTSDLSSLTDGSGMFYGCKLDTASIKNIAETINDVTSLEDPDSCCTTYKTIDIGIGNASPNEQEVTAFNTIASKGWTVYVNGSEYTPTSPAAITTLDELGEEITTPIPYWAKPVQSDEEHAKYIDSEGNFFNIVGAQFIYGDDISTYGMFTCEEDAAQNIRLTPYIKPQTETNNK